MLDITYEAGVKIGRNDKWQVIPESVAPNWMAEALLGEWQAFVEAINSDTEPAVSGAYARHIMATAFAAEESSRLKQEITVPPNS